MAAGIFGFDVRLTAIPVGGGVELSAVVLTPGGPGPHPLLVLPASWSVDRFEYVGAAAKLVHSSLSGPGGGYAVVSFTSRGFRDSGGQIDVAGADTVGDVSRVIDWALANLPVDAARIGAVGISYGAGTSLLAGAVDDRIAAIAAMSTWTDLAASFYPNRTESTAAATILLDSAARTGRPGPVLTALQDDYARGDDEATLPVLHERSPVTRLAALNTRRVPVLLANAWEDAFFPPSQVVEFFGALTGPKRLLLAPGDHATAELPGLIGLPDDPWAAVRGWMDEHLLGAPPAGPPVMLRPANSGGWQSYDAWPPVHPSRLYLTQDGLQQRSAGDWAHPLAGGVPTLADSGLPLLSGALIGYLRLPVGVALPFISHRAAGVWAYAHRTAPGLLVGAPRLRLTVTPSTPDTSLFAYLYDVDVLGLGALMTTKPYSLVGVQPGQPVAVEFDLEPITWTLHTGRRLALAVDTVDLRYRSRATVGSTVTLSGTAEDPSWIDLPITDLAPA